MKLCKSCSTRKRSSYFHNRKASLDGLAAKCKDCQSSYDKARANNPDRVAARKAYSLTEDGKTAGNRAKKKWAANNKNKIYKTTKAYREKYPKKYNAHRKLRYAIICGDIVKGSCENCWSEENIHGHHDDYLKPYEVRWLCVKHHKQWHAINGEGLNP